MGAGIVTMSCLRGRIEGNRVEGNLGKVNIGPGQIGLCDYQNAAGPHGITGVTDVTIRDNLVILDRDNTTAFSAVHISEGPEWERVGFTDNRIVFFDHAAGQYAYDIGTGPRIETYSGNRFFGTGSEDFRAVAPGGPYAWESWRARGLDEGTAFAPLDDTAPSRITGLTAARTERGTELRWNAARDSRSGVHHYNVYCGDRPDFPRRYVTLVGQPTGISFVDEESGDDGAPRWYAVEAEDMCGNRSGWCVSVSVAFG
ncbi:MAG: hypothetical protein EA426_01955 [Spirochaetaceae bacterium]|nr:MAG: hypothetical protein EA426_01955 [Spirochaetaceae bacterium]